MTLASWVGIGTVAASAATVVSLAAVIWQLRMLARQTEDAASQTRLNGEANQAAVRMTLWKEMLKIDRFLCDRPELRAAVYGPPAGDLSAGTLHAQRVEASAEMVFDFIECLLVHESHFDGEIGGGWLRYFAELLGGSAALRDFWHRQRQWYEAIQKYIDPIVADLTPAARASRCLTRLRPVPPGC